MFSNSDPEHSYQSLWMAMGSAVIGTAFGGMAVWLALSFAVPEQVMDASRAGVVNTTATLLDPTPRGSAAAGGALHPAARGLADVAERAQGSVVSIKYEDRLLGAGVIVSTQGGILTNHHVIEPALLGADDGEARVFVRFVDGRELAARISVWDVDQDIAVLRVVGGVDGEIFSPAPAGTSSSLRVGDGIFVVGCPLGLEHTVSLGIVSALDRIDQLPNPSLPAIQIDASINVGNSGGPLFNLHGELVGITTTRARNGQGIGFAIPIDRILAFLQNWDSGGGSSEIGIEVLGREVSNEDLVELGYVHGVHVNQVFEGPAQAAGMRKGDVIVELRGRRFDPPPRGMDPRVNPLVLKQFQRVVGSLIPGESLMLTVVRDRALVELQVRARAMSQFRRGIRLTKRVLGLELAAEAQLSESPPSAGREPEGDAPAVVSKVVPGSALDHLLERASGDPRSRQRTRTRLLGAEIVEIGGYAIDGIERLGSVLSYVERLTTAGANPKVHVGFRDAEGREFIFGPYPL